MTAPAQMGSTRPALSTFPNFGIGLCSGRGLSFVCHRWDIGDAADSRKRGTAAREAMLMMTWWWKCTKEMNLADLFSKLNECRERANRHEAEGHKALAKIARRKALAAQTEIERRSMAQAGV